MTAETMMKEYRSLKRELSVTGFQLQRFEGISEKDMIESMLYSHHEGERVRTSTLSDKTAGIAVNYRKIMERENDGWYQYLFNRYLYLSEEIDFFERSVYGVIVNLKCVGAFRAASGRRHGFSGRGTDMGEHSGEVPCQHRHDCKV